MNDVELLAVKRSNGFSFHVMSDGKPAYQQRYLNVEGFRRVTDGRFLAVAKDQDGQFHITPDGRPAYQERYWSSLDAIGLLG